MVVKLLAGGPREAEEAGRGSVEFECSLFMKPSLLLWPGFKYDSIEPLLIPANDCIGAVMLYITTIENYKTRASNVNK